MNTGLAKKGLGILLSAFLFLGLGLVSPAVHADYLETACGTDADGDGVANSWRTQTYGSPCYSSPAPSLNEPISRSCWHWSECMSLTRDNCLSVSNSNQSDVDGDGAGDVCDAFPNDSSEKSDSDGDGVGNNADNCKLISNASQVDTDGDGVGDVCDAFPSDASESTDTDGDGVGNNADAFPNNAEATTDTDGDGKPDSINTLKLPVLKSFEYGAGSGWTYTSSYAGNQWSVVDGAATAYNGTHALQFSMTRNAAGTSSASLILDFSAVSVVSWYQRISMSNISWGGVWATQGGPVTPTCQDAGNGWNYCVARVTPSADGNKFVISVSLNNVVGAGGNIWIDDLSVGTLVEDTDDDNDGVADTSDAFPLDATESVDTDNDGTGNNADTDDDGDGVADASDAFPLDASESLDTDGDGIGDNADNCAAVANASQTDADGDGMGDACDSTPNGDTDNDGIDNLVDNCASVSNSNQLDWDNNGIGDACDAPVPVPSDTDGAAKAEKTGAAVAFAGDFDGDGYGDYVIGSPNYSIPAAPPVKAMIGAGKAEVISGKDGSVLASVVGTAAKDAMGFAVAGNADIDHDSFADVVVGAPNATAMHVGKVVVLYGGAGNRRHTFWGATKNTGFGSALALGDVDGDDHADVLIGAPKDKNPISNQKAIGSVTVYDGASLQSRKRFYGKTSNAYAGTAVATADVNGDGLADIIVGAPGESGMGSVRVYNHSGTELLQKMGANKKAQFGKAVASADINHDDHADIVVGAPLDDVETNKDAGSISVISGSDGSLLTPAAFGAVKKAWLGSSVALADVNGDGTLDIIASAPQDNNVPTATTNTGSVTVWNGATYAPIKTVYGDAFGDLFGAVVSTGDINSDGKADILIGMPNKDVELESSVQKDAGGVKVINATAL